VLLRTVWAYQAITITIVCLSLTGTSQGLAACSLMSEPGYVIYSACGSFWVPMIIMTMFYARIYRTASRASAAVRRGFIPAGDVTARSSTSRSSRFFGRNQSPLSPSKSETCIALRVHRGGSLVQFHIHSRKNRETKTKKKKDEEEDKQE